MPFHKIDSSNNYTIISSDSHVIESPRLWYDRMDVEFGNRIPHLQKDGPYDNWFCNGEVVSMLRSFMLAGKRLSEPESVKPKGSFSDVPAGGYDPHAEATYPESQLILNEILSGGSLSERALIVGQNCARLYNFQTYLRQ